MTSDPITRMRQHFQAEEWAATEQACLEILEAQPEQPEAFYRLGWVYAQVGQPDLGVELLTQAIRLEPGQRDFHIALAEVWEQQQQWSSAGWEWQTVISLDPQDVSAYGCWAKCLLQQNLLPEAIQAYRQALQVKPDFAQAHNNLANILGDQLHWADAIYHYQVALQLEPDNPEFLYNLGTTYLEQENLAEAEAYLRQALQLKPTYAAAHTNLARTLMQANQPNEAIFHAQQAVEAQPTDPLFAFNLGSMYQDLGRLSAAIDYYDRTLALDPTFLKAEWNRTFTLLMQGNLLEGLRCHERRFQTAPIVTPTAHDLPYPTWDGSELQGRRILIYAEQGLGDSLQFVRYASLVSERGGSVWLLCPPVLGRLLKTVKGTVQIASDVTELPDFDYKIAMLSLPYVFGTTLETIPAQIPYFEPPDPAACGDLFPPTQNLRVGLVWSSHPGYPAHQQKSCPLATYLQLLQVETVEFYSLQKEVSDQEREILGQHSDRIRDLQPLLTDFAATANLISHLDLIISVDTAPAHLAGGLGKPTWILLPFSPDWRWLQHREDSPWYPTARLFRQFHPNDWTTVIARVTTALADWHRIRNSKS